MPDARNPLRNSYTRKPAFIAKALSQSLENIGEIVAMYALVNRIRLFACRGVLEAGEAFVNKLIAQYGEKNMTIEQIGLAAIEQHADSLTDFA